ncbi:LOW QUALITY PROTEIN: hypothetical protein HID58_006134 [Brassica napus]|uniref:RNB domain-containing protein n=1 Tax=Brassica napus TaxID=3708 RepID=A0ABQ8EB54_BRANA|nr:LOW QUALITY PROTEIN: hypothetical protein HID58_006134 [Brassica napus]
MKKSVVSAEQQSAKAGERIENGDKDKKKKRRGSRRSKNTSGCVVEDIHVESSDDNNPNELTRASNVAFNSMPYSSASPLVPSAEVSKQLLSKSCPDPRDCEQSSIMDADLFQQVDECVSLRNIFSSHWSLDAVNQALEKGEVYKALFRVNAHNRSEAYCRLMEYSNQWNRWPKSSIPKEKDERLSHLERGEIDAQQNKCSVIGQGAENCVSRNSMPLLDSCSLGEQTGNGTAVEKLCVILSSFPNKRPTGQVVAVVEKSLVRDSIVGLLDVKRWIHYKEANARTSKSLSDDDYIQLMPADPRFTKLIVPFHALPGGIRARLESMDPTLEAELVAAQIVDWSEGSQFPLAQITHMFGRGSELEPQINAILYQNSVCDSEFSHDSLASLPRAPWEVPEEEVQRRKDLRDLCVFTIDPSTATDLDDALSVQSLPGGFLRVGVHIADVSYYVLPDTALDTEAQFRSTSVYMLREKNTNVASIIVRQRSLNPGVDRLAFSIFLDLNREGVVTDRWIGRTVIKSCCKLSYDHAQDIIDEKHDVAANSRPALHGPFEWSDVVRSIKQLSEISTNLRQKRFRNGALQLENSKPSFLFDEHGVPYEFVLYPTKASNHLVEEFMLLANMTAAEDDAVFVDILNNYAMKPMQSASYFCTGNLKDCVAEWGHYALAVPLYTHFTSPLRRYPDIVVHRAVAAALEAEECFLKQKQISVRSCFTGVHFDKDAVESMEGKEALSVAGLKHGVPSTERVSEIAAYCNERKLASRRVKDACDKLYTWCVYPCEARVMNLGPMFMTIYISKLGIERRIYYDRVEGLCADWLEATSTLILDKLEFKRGGRGYLKPLKEVAYLVSPSDTCAAKCSAMSVTDTTEQREEVVPAVFPLTVQVFSTIPVALHAVGGDDGPLDIGARLYVSSYYR